MCVRLGIVDLICFSDFRKSSDVELVDKEVLKNVNIQFDLKHKEAAFSSSLSQIMLLPLQAQDVNDWCSSVEAEIKDLGKYIRTFCKDRHAFDEYLHKEILRRQL